MRVNSSIVVGSSYLEYILRLLVMIFMKKHDDDEAKTTQKSTKIKHLNEDKKINRVNSSVVGTSFLEYILRLFVQCDKWYVKYFMDNVYLLVFGKNK